MTRQTRSVAAALMAGAVLSLAACGGSGGGGFSNASGPSQKAGKASLNVLIASLGAAETAAVTSAAAAWSTKSGNTATVTAAQNMDQQLGQAFAANKAPDVFYLDASKLADYASQGALYEYGDKAAGAADFYPSLKDAFSVKGTFYCAPKDFSTLALEINSAMWTKAGLTSADVPTTWEQLTKVLTTLKSTMPTVAPLVVSTGHDRIDAFLVQAGGNIVDKDGKPTAQSPQNVQGLTYAKSLLTQSDAANHPLWLIPHPFSTKDSIGRLANGASGFSMKQFFESVPVSIEEAARMDGASTFRIFWSVVLPMARPALITLTILSFQGSWNEFSQVLVAVQSADLYTLPLWLGNLVTGSLGAGTQYPLKLSGALLATIPVALMFALLQRYFIRGANEGAVKG